MKNNFLKITPFTAFALFVLIANLASCGEKYVFEEKKDIPNGQWAYADTIDFKVPVTDTTQLYNLYIEFTLADSFPNQNAYLKLKTRFPDGKRVSRIRSFDFFDPEGNPIGKCSSKECKSRMLLQDNLYFNQVGEYLITLEQYTRTNPLNGLTAIGIALEKTDKKR